MSPSSGALDGADDAVRHHPQRKRDLRSGSQGHHPSKKLMQKNHVLQLNI